MRLSKEASKIEPWAAYRLNELGLQLSREGYDVINAAGGEPNHRPNIVALENGIKLLLQHRGNDSGEGRLAPLIDDLFDTFNISAEHNPGSAMRYPQMQGHYEYRSRLSKVLSKRLNSEISPENIVFGNGGMSLISSALRVISDLDEPVITHSPNWGGYRGIVEKNLKRKLITIDVSETGFVLTPEKLEEAIIKQIEQKNSLIQKKQNIIASLKEAGLFDGLVAGGLLGKDLDDLELVDEESFSATLILNYPCNPTGADMSEAEYKALASVLMRFPNINIIEDSIYRDFAETPLSLYQVAPSLRDRIVSMASGSKIHALAGERVGYALADPEVAKKIASAEMARPSVVAQEILTSSEENYDEYRTDITSLYNDRVTFFTDRLQGSGLILDNYRPKNTFYVMVNAGSLLGQKISTKASEIIGDLQKSSIESTLDICFDLAARYGVITTPGPAFNAAEGTLRVVTTADKDDLDKLAQRLKHANDAAVSGHYSEKAWTAPPMRQI